MRLFEGHLSFKGNNDTPPEKTDEPDKDKRDALALKNAVWNGTRLEIFEPHELVEDSDLYIESPFPFFCRKLVPPVVRVTPDITNDQTSHS